jgi:hypothetical protein
MMHYVQVTVTIAYFMYSISVSGMIAYDSDIVCPTYDIVCSTYNIVYNITENTDIVGLFYSSYMLKTAAAEFWNTITFLQVLLSLQVTCS